MGKRLLPKRDMHWFIGVPVIAPVLTAVLSLIVSRMLAITLGTFDIMILGMFSLIVALAICGFGYAGLLIASASCLVGVIVGIVFMIYVFTQPVEWKGITES